MLYHCRRDQRGLVAAAPREVFNAENQDQARERIGHVIARLEPIVPKVCRLLEDAEEDPIVFYLFPREHWTKLRSTHPLESVNKEIGPAHRRRWDLPQRRRRQSVSPVPSSPERNEEWLVQRRYLSVESMQLILSAGWTEENSLEQQHHQEVDELTPA